MHVPFSVKIQKYIKEFIDKEKNLAMKVGKLNLHLQEFKVNEDMSVNRYDVSMQCCARVNLCMFVRCELVSVNV